LAGVFEPDALAAGAAAALAALLAGAALSEAGLLAGVLLTGMLSSKWLLYPYHHVGGAAVNGGAWSKARGL